MVKRHITSQHCNNLKQKTNLGNGLYIGLLKKCLLKTDGVNKDAQRLGRGLGGETGHPQVKF